MDAVIDSKSSRRRAGAGWAPILAAALAAAGCGPAGDAGEVAVDQQAALAENLNTVRTRWWAFYGKTGDEVGQLLTSNNGRLVGLQVESTSPLKFTGAMVENTGTHYKGKSWWFNATGDSLASKIVETGARPTNLVPYVVNGTTYFAATLISNTGADWKRWWWYYDATWEFVLQKLRENYARPADLRQYYVNGVKKYAVIMVANDGISGTPYRDVTRDQIASYVRNGAGYLISIEPADAAGNTFNVIVNGGNPGTEWWYWTGDDWDTMVSTASQNGHRLLDVKTYFVGAQRRFVGIAVDNADPDSARVRQMLRDDLLKAPDQSHPATGGKFGFYLKSIDAPLGEPNNVKEELLADGAKFDPASALKTLVAARVLRLSEQQNAWFNLDTQIWYYPFPQPTKDQRGNDVYRWCPTDRASGDVQQKATVRELIRKMLVDSDNWATRALVDSVAGGFAGLNQTAADAAMTSTRFAGHIGCRPGDNTTTIEDLALLYQGIQRASLVNATNREILFSLMPASGGDPLSALGRVRAIVNEEAAKVGLSWAQTTKFRDAVSLHYKDGYYTWNSTAIGALAQTRAIGGIAEFPHCSGASTWQYHLDRYAWGVYIDTARVVDMPTGTQANLAFSRALAEPLRKPIRERLLSWSVCSR